MTDNPLKVADPRSLDEIHSADPETITDEEFLLVIEDFRKQRPIFEEQEKLGKTKGRRRPTTHKAELSLKDLKLSK